MGYALYLAQGSGGHESASIVVVQQGREATTIPFPPALVPDGGLIDYASPSGHAPQHHYR